MSGVFLPAGHQMTMVASATKAGNYTLEGSPTSYTVLSAGSTVTIGPFATGKQYNVNNLSYSQAPYIVSSSDVSGLQTQIDAIAHGGEAIEDLAVDADAEAISVAVNAIIAALVTAGIIVEDV